MEKEREVRLRRRIEELVRSRVGLLEQDISRLQREVNESFTRLLERTDVAATMSESDEALAHISAEVTAQVDQASAESVRLGADIALLRDSVAELDEQRTQAEVLNALVARAANFAPRVVLFVVKGSNALAWAARGLDESAGGSGGATSIRGLSIQLQSDTVLRAALNSQQTFYGSPDQQAENGLIFSRLGNAQPQRVLAVPLKVRGKSAAVVYADSADNGEDATNVEAIELLVHTAGMVVELVSLRARIAEGAQAAARQPAAPSNSAQPSAASSAPEPRPTAESAPRTGGTLAAPPAIAPETQPAAPVERHAQAGVSGELNQPAPDQQEASASSRAVPGVGSPAPTYFRPTAEPPPASEAQVAPPPPPADSSADRWGGAGGGGRLNIQTDDAAPMRPAESSVTPHGGAVDEEEKLHKDARRFARLLVSEIKLYNEQKVSEGRRNHDLYDRLKEDIDRSRQMYEKRVTPGVAAKFDYFYDELVNTLAEGDKAKLGSDHPGPSVVV
ncbi:MAG TPA: hypothetical protein VNI02_04945 [Blastocatellia bacterium]|nr:hypothetical protein [Blastocatellia bacterium]